MTMALIDVSEIPAVDAHGHRFEKRALTWQLLLDNLSLSMRGSAPALNDSKLLSHIAVRGLAEFFACAPVEEGLIAACNAAANDDYAPFVGSLLAPQRIVGLRVDPGYPARPAIDAHYPRRPEGSVVYDSFSN